MHACHSRNVASWDAGTGQVVAGPWEGHTNRVFSAAFSPDGKQVVSGSLTKRFAFGMLRLVTGPFKGHPNRVLSVAFSPDGEWVVSGSEESIHIWDAETGQIIAGPFGGHMDGVMHSHQMANGGLRLW